MLVWVPTPVAHALDAMGGVPDGVHLEHWNGSEPLPATADEVRFVVPVPGFARGELLTRLPSLEIVQLLSAGVDGIDGVDLPGVTVCNAGDANAASVADWVMAVLLADVRMLDAFSAIQAARRWERKLGASMDALRVLIVGYGAIGKAVGARLVPFGSTVIPLANRARPAEGVHGIGDLDSLLPEADVVVVLAPLTPDTRGMFDARRLALLKEGALLVNAGRGAVVDTAALIDVLHAGRIRAALDVTDPEPIPADHPLWDAPNLRLTPHIAGGTTDFFRFTYPVVRRQLERVVAGQPLTDVVKSGDR
jgi:phosphoglycerate dehydrogenase-like enzyme